MANKSKTPRAGGTSKSAPSGSGKDDAIELLKSQHREVESLFKQFKRAENDNESFELAQVICQKLTVHATIEEELLYPLARSRGEEGELKALVLESLEEHRSVKRLIGDIQQVEAGDETLEAKVSVLREQVSHHVDEEEDELFPRLTKEVSRDERRELGQKLVERAGELEAADGEDDEKEGGQEEEREGVVGQVQVGNGTRQGRAPAHHHHP